VELVEAPLQLPIELGAFAWIPVAAMARLARLVEILADVPQLGDVLPLRDVERLERHVSQRFDARIPLDGIALHLGGDLRRREFDGVRAGAVVFVAGRRERPPNLEEVRAFGERDGAGADLVPVVFGLRLDVDRPLPGDRGSDRVEDVVGDRIDHVLHQLFHRDDRLEVAPERRLRGGRLRGGRRRFRRRAGGCAAQETEAGYRENTHGSRAVHRISSG